jgi:hypothetical protein
VSLTKQRAEAFLVELNPLVRRHDVRIEAWGYEVEGLVLESCSQNEGHYELDSSVEWQMDLKWVDE